MWLVWVSTLVNTTREKKEDDISHPNPALAPVLHCTTHFSAVVTLRVLEWSRDLVCLSLWLCSLDCSARSVSWGHYLVQCSISSSWSLLSSASLWHKSSDNFLLFVGFATHFYFLWLYYEKKFLIFENFKQVSKKHYCTLYLSSSGNLLIETPLIHLTFSKLYYC